ncbi:MAG: hypothetical protein AAFX40_10060 [Cyanobacteria bacterium J06639_1]
MRSRALEMISHALDEAIAALCVQILLSVKTSDGARSLFDPSDTMMHRARGAR